jgi:hypothetical protein
MDCCVTNVQISQHWQSDLCHFDKETVEGQFENSNIPLIEEGNVARDKTGEIQTDPLPAAPTG